MRVSTLPAQPAMVAAAFLFFSALRPQIETLQPGRRQRLRDAEPDAAIAAGDDGDAAGEVENTHERFQSGLARALDGRPMAGRCSVTTMDKAAQKIKYGLEIETLCTAGRNNAGHNS